MLSLNVTQNKTAVFKLSVYKADGVTPQSIVGMTLGFRAVSSSFSLFKSSPSNGITIDNTAGGLNCATLQIEPADTAELNMPPGRIQTMPCALILENGVESYQLDQGTMAFTGLITSA